MYAYFLVLIFLGHTSQEPVIIGSAETLYDCEKAANTARNNPAMAPQEVKDLKPILVCYKAFPSKQV
jgi:hypothetical protein